MCHPEVMPETAIRIEPSQKWLRGFLNGEAVVDSKRVLVAYGLQRRPIYCFPESDVRLDQLRGVDGAFQSLEGPTELKGYVAFDWKKFDAWFEEDEEIFAYPRDPYHRVDVLNSSRHIKVVVGGEVVAESSRARLLFETGLPTRYYLPKTDVRMEFLEPTSTSSQCPYKGNAVYWSVKVGDQVFPDVVWSYPFPTPESEKIQNLLAFYNEKVELFVDGERWQRQHA
jgi:uncharacterized protein (DUF427 family)